MARPANADAAATRHRILASATRLFAERGSSGSSVRAIASSAGVSLAMVHHYFGSKGGLYEACIDQMYAELGPLSAELASALADGRTLAETIERAVRYGFRFARERQQAVRMLQRMIMETGELDAALRERQQRPFLDRASAAIAARVGGDEVQARLGIQSVVMLTTRYALSSDGELAFLAGAEDADAPVEAAASRVADHLVGLALALLLPPNTQNSPTDD